MANPGSWDLFEEFLQHFEILYIICSHLLNQKTNKTEGQGGCGQIILDCKMVNLYSVLKEPLDGDGVTAIARLSLSV